MSGLGLRGCKGLVSSLFWAESQIFDSIGIVVNLLLTIVMTMFTVQA